MDALTTIARRRQVIATVADAIVAAAEGSDLRVMVDGGCSDAAAFADHDSPTIRRIEPPGAQWTA